MQHYCDVFPRTTLQRTSKEVHVYMRRHQTSSFAYAMLVTRFIKNVHTVTFPIAIDSMGETLMSC